MVDGLPGQKVLVANLLLRAISLFSNAVHHQHLVIADAVGFAPGGIIPAKLNDGAVDFVQQAQRVLLYCVPLP